MAKRRVERAASNTERGRASTLRSRLDAGARIGARDREWLEQYDADRRRFARERAERKPKRPPSARVEAERIARWVADYITEGDFADVIEVDSAWVRKPARGRGGIARAEATWGDEPVIPTRDVERAWWLVVNHSDRVANVRVLVRVGDRPPVWTSLTALTSRWDNIPADMLRALDELETRPSLRAGDEDADVGIVAVSVQVSNARVRKPNAPRTELYTPKRKRKRR